MALNSKMFDVPKKMKSHCFFFQYIKVVTSLIFIFKEQKKYNKKFIKYGGSSPNYIKKSHNNFS